ncbi:hypothetical protein [Legionella gresilensis]|uniref:hypothetical protein n=1 Tax=Legionella gresilensis TaxID=91823 RepID=UPI00104187C8|nr:hypothetical protein [Legionella gresilensis]
MPFSKQYKAFRDDKYSFFQNTSDKSIEMIDMQVREKSFKFLSVNKALIEQEFSQLYASLSKNKDKQEEFWLYCYYCCSMLEAYYLDYDQHAKVAEYRDLREQIWQELEEHKENPNKEQKVAPSFIKELGQKVSSDLKDLATSVKHASKLRNEVGLLNMGRMYWTFCRLTLTNSFQHLAKNTHWLEQLSKWINKPIDAENIVKQLETPNEIMRALSVGFFVARFIINAGIVLKHTFSPTDAEKELSKWERFSKEVSKRHAEFLNDIVWATVNGITNYAEFFHISATAAGWITAGFLMFDVGLLLWRHHLAEQEYLRKKSEYQEEFKHYEQLLVDAAKNNNQVEVFRLKKHCDLIKEQQKELELNWKVNSSTFLFNTAAALLLAAGFSAAMIVGFPVLVPLSYAVCTIAVTMYLSAPVYSQFKDKKLRLTQAEVDNASEKDMALALKEYQAARQEFILTMVKNAVLPGVMIATFAICWEAALVLTAVYLTYKLYEAYEKHKANKPQVKMVEFAGDPESEKNKVVQEPEEDEDIGSYLSCCPT